MNRLEGKVTMITGSASGIGKEIAELFAKEGAKVVITTRKKVAEGTALAESIKNDGGEAAFIKLDVRKESNWSEALDVTIRKYGKLNILVNNAGIVIAKTLEDTSLDEWNSVMETNSTGVFLGTKYAIGAMKNNCEPCSIVNISSVMVYVGDPELAAYNVSKGAVAVLSKTAALHCGDAGYTIRVNSVFPGFIHTEMADIEAEERGMTIDEFTEEFLQYHPIGYLGKPDDVAYTVLYLASDESKFVTGAELAVDGGWSAR